MGVADLEEIRQPRPDHRPHNPDHDHEQVTKPVVGPTMGPTTASTGPQRPSAPPPPRWGEVRVPGCGRTGMAPAWVSADCLCSPRRLCIPAAQQPGSPTAQGPGRRCASRVHIERGDHCAAASVHTAWHAKGSHGRSDHGWSRACRGFRGGRSVVVAASLGQGGANPHGRPDHSPDHGPGVVVCASSGRRVAAPDGVSAN